LLDRHRVFHHDSQSTDRRSDSQTVKHNTYVPRSASASASPRPQRMHYLRIRHAVRVPYSSRCVDIFGLRKYIPQYGRTTEEQARALILSTLSIPHSRSSNARSLVCPLKLAWCCRGYCCMSVGQRELHITHVHRRSSYPFRGERGLCLATRHWMRCASRCEGRILCALSRVSPLGTYMANLDWPDEHREAARSSRLPLSSCPFNYLPTITY
jgi:hypothetical protein